MDVSAVAVPRVSALDAPIGRNHSVGPVVRRRRRRTVREALGLYLLGSGMVGDWVPRMGPAASGTTPIKLVQLGGQTLSNFGHSTSLRSSGLLDLSVAVTPPCLSARTGRRALGAGCFGRHNLPFRTKQPWQFLALLPSGFQPRGARRLRHSGTPDTLPACSGSGFRSTFSAPVGLPAL